MSKLKLVSSVLILASLMMSCSNNDILAQRPGINQDESKVPEFELPKLMTVDSISDWESNRRPELLQLFSDHVYGHVPDKLVEAHYSILPAWDVLEGKATRREMTMSIQGDPVQVVTILLTIPKSETPVPCFVGYNFHGNHTTTSDPNVAIPTSWVQNKQSHGSTENRASEEGRGKAASRWPYHEIISRGYAVATIYYGDIDPDFDDQFKNGVQPKFYRADQSKPDKNQWGSIGAWAWGLSIALDGLESITAIDASHVAVIGHSRLGKTSLWAGANDPRFWLTISNDSGCGGAALHRRKFGETVKVINTNFPHWFCDQFAEYNDRENEIPVDQHQLIALIAPRLVYVASASEDLWADPKGEFLSLVNANEAFEIYGDESMTTEMPKPDSPISTSKRAYHLRSGKHDITMYDWQQYLNFADKNLSHHDSSK